MRGESLKLKLNEKEKLYLKVLADTYEYDGDGSLLTQEEFNALMQKLKSL